jgi:hypothetical protein
MLHSHALIGRSPYAMRIHPGGFKPPVAGLAIAPDASRFNRAGRYAGLRSCGTLRCAALFTALLTMPAEPVPPAVGHFIGATATIRPLARWPVSGVSPALHARQPAGTAR